MKAYVYKIIVDDVVRYIGKGTGKRAMSHISAIRSIMRRRTLGETVKASHFHNRLAKAYRNGADIQIEIVADNLSDAAAFDLGNDADRHASRIVELAGGDAPPRATKRSPEFIAKVTASNKARWADPELRQAQADMKKVHWLKPEYRAVISKPRGKQSKMSDAAKAMEILKRAPDLSHHVQPKTAVTQPSAAGMRRNSMGG